MNLLLATLAAPLATAGIGAIPGPRRPKEAVFLGGLAATLALALATARRYLAGETPSAFGEALRVDGLSALVLVLTASRLDIPACASLAVEALQSLRARAEQAKIA